MTANLELEDRLRTGLRAAADAIPTPPDAVPSPGEQFVQVQRSTPAGATRLAALRRRPAIVALATAAALAALAGTAAVVTGGGETGPVADVAAAADEPTTTTTSPPHVPRPVNGMVPGRAVGGDGVLHLFGPDGRPAGPLDVAPLGVVRSAGSDLEGGWVVCGSVEKTSEEIRAGLDPESRAALDELGDSSSWTVPEGGTVPPPTVAIEERIQAPGPINVDVLMWFPAGGAPVELDGNVGYPGCLDSTVQVVDSPDGAVVLVGGVSFGDLVSEMEPRLEGVVLASGERREYPVPSLEGLPMQWSMSTGKVITYVEGAGLQLFDLETTELVPTATIDPGDASDLALSPDGTTAAVLKGEIAGPVEAIVYDLATGAELYRRSFDLSTEGDQMSYDGTTLAVGNFYDGYGPVTVIDVASGAEHTVDAHGFVL
jgi:hypothetical protein